MSEGLEEPPRPLRDENSEQGYLEALFIGVNRLLTSRARQDKNIPFYQISEYGYRLLIHAMQRAFVFVRTPKHIIVIEYVSMDHASV